MTEKFPKFRHYTTDLESSENTQGGKCQEIIPRHNILKLQKTKEKTLKEARVKNTSSTEKQKQELHPMPPKPCKEEDGVKYLEVERKKPKHL